MPKIPADLPYGVTALQVGIKRGLIIMYAEADGSHVLDIGALDRLTWRQLNQLYNEIVTVPWLAIRSDIAL